MNVAVRALGGALVLALSAGAAAADVSVGGNGRMGLHFDGDDWNFTSRVRVSFELSGQTQNGLTFGGSIRADNAFDGARGAAGEIFVSGAFGKVTMGDIDGAAESAVGNVSGVGLTGLGDFNESFYLFDQISAAQHDPKLMYSYSFGGVSFFASVVDGNGSAGGRGIGFHPPSGVGDVGFAVNVYAAGLSYEGTFAQGSFQVGIGYEHFEAQALAARNEQIALGGSLSFGDTTLKAMWGMVDGNYFNTGHQYGLSIDQTFGATALTAFFRVNDYEAFPVERWIGLGASYDLGGGAKVVAGVVFEDLGPGGDDVFGDIGLSFSF